MSKFSVGDNVVVAEAATGHEFQATVIDIRDFENSIIYIVEDQNSDVFDISETELTRG